MASFSNLKRQPLLFSGCVSKIVDITYSNFVIPSPIESGFLGQIPANSIAAPAAENFKQYRGYYP